MKDFNSVVYENSLIKPLGYSASVLEICFHTASTPLPHFAEKLSSIFGAQKGQSTISFLGR
jgi:hypothetical protein